MYPHVLICPCFNLVFIKRAVIPQPIYLLLKTGIQKLHNNRLQLCYVFFFVNT